MSRDDYDVQVVRYADRKFLMLRYIDPLSGKQVTKSARTTNRREAERAAAQWEAELRKGGGSPSREMAWEGFRERYEDEVVPALAVRTGAMMDTVFNAIEEFLQPKRLRDLTADRLSYFQSCLRAKGLAEPTIRTYLAHTKSALKWAVNLGLLAAVPKVQMPKRVKKSKLMKGRPITAEEFERMLEKVAAVVGQASAAKWQYLLRGLWYSGLRLSEALDLHWDRGDRLRVELGLSRPMLIIPGELEKGNQDRILPMSPEFAMFLLATPEPLREGAVFRLPDWQGKLRSFQSDWASRTISKIGKKAGIKVHTDVKTGKTKYASAHDLRRSFGERWARRVMPQVLKELMRHESIETTMKYYVGTNAQLTADVLWAVHEKGIAESRSTGGGTANVEGGAPAEEPKNAGA